MDCLEQLRVYLTANRVDFEVTHHAVAYTAHDVAASEHIPDTLVAKVVMAIADGRLIMLVLPAPYRVDLEKAAVAVGASSVRLADEREFATVFADCDVGAMPPFGNLYHVPVYADHSLAEREWMVFTAGTHTDTIGLEYADFVRLVKPIVGDLGQAHVAQPA